MQKLKKKLRWLLYRHPMLYYIRFYLYKRKFNKNLIDNECYNDYNSKKDIPEIYHTINKTLPLENDTHLDKAVRLAKELRLRIKGGRGLGLSSGRAIEIMIKGEGGTCSDITQAYNNFSIINDIKIREWGIIDKIYDAEFGHAFNEYYSEELQKWVIVDISKAIYFIDPKTNTKLSSIELFDYVQNDKPVQHISFISDQSLDFNKDLDTRINYIYLQKDRLPFLISNYKVKFYDRLLNTFQSWLPTFVTHFIAVLLFKNVRFILLQDESKIV